MAFFANFETNIETKRIERLSMSMQHLTTGVLSKRKQKLYAKVLIILRTNYLMMAFTLGVDQILDFERKF